jgi:hypothetical protein
MDTVLSIVVLAAVALTFGAIYLWRRGGVTKQVWLMLLLVMVMIVNVLIWTLPGPDGTAPLDQVETTPQ